jgi:AT-rich interactive domain-containing protein 1
MLVLGRLLLLHHTHPVRNPEQHKFDREVELDTGSVVEDSTKQWWWDTLDALREHTLVTLANISGQVNLITYPEEICLPILDGLLHWAVCLSAYAQDPLPTMSSHSVLSAQRLALEALCKLCITDSNVDLLLATPPFSRIVQLLGNLVKLIADRNDQVMREFSIVLLSSLVQGEGSAARAVSLQHPSISLLIDFIESAEHQALQIANTHAGISRLQENPEMMGTSLDMLRRTALILRSLAEVPENINLFQPHQHRLLHLVMSQILDHRVATILSDVLFNCAQQS